MQKSMKRYVSDVVLVVVVPFTTCIMRNAPRNKFILAAVKISPAVKLAGSAVGVAISISLEHSNRLTCRMWHCPKSVRKRWSFD